MILRKEVADYVRWSVNRQPIWGFPNYTEACHLMGDDDLLARARELHAQHHKLAKAYERLCDDISWRLDHQKGEEDPSIPVPPVRSDA